VYYSVAGISVLCVFCFVAQKPTRLEATSAAQAGGPYGKAADAAAAGDGSRLLHPVAGRKGMEEGLNPSCLMQIFCSAMPWVDCTRLRYHCTKLPDINLCPQVGEPWSYFGRMCVVGRVDGLVLCDKWGGVGWGGVGWGGVGWGGVGWGGWAWGGVGIGWVVGP
jgi:hypothetical protein